MFFYFFVSSNFHAFSDAEKFRENSYIEKKNFECNFQTAIISPAF